MVKNTMRAVSALTCFFAAVPQSVPTLLASFRPPVRVWVRQFALLMYGQRFLRHELRTKNFVSTMSLR